MANICRICLYETTTDRLSNIFIKYVTESIYLPSNEIIENNKLLIWEIIQKLTKLSIKNDDGLPKQICANCEYRVIDSYLLCRLIEKSYEKQINNRTKKQTKLVSTIDDNKLIIVENIDLSRGGGDGDIEHLQERNEEVIEIYEINNISNNNHHDIDGGLNIDVVDPSENDEAVFIESNAMTVDCEDNNLNINNGDNEVVEYHLNEMTNTININIIDELNGINQTEDNFNDDGDDNNDEDDDNDDDNAVSFILKGIIPNENSRRRKEGTKPILLGDSNKEQRKIRSKTPHVCEICSRIFTRKSNLIDHLRWHTNERPFKCKYCEKTFIQSGNLQQHIRIHTNERPFICNFSGCFKSYNHSSALRVHIRSHTKEKSYICPECDKRFSNGSDLSKHRRTHYSATHYKCEQCQRTFAQKINFKLHKKKKHGIIVE